LAGETRFPEDVLEVIFQALGDDSPITLEEIRKISKPKESPQTKITLPTRERRLRT
jgi:hypothetical protein